MFEFVSHKPHKSTYFFRFPKILFNQKEDRKNNYIANCYLRKTIMPKIEYFAI